MQSLVKDAISTFWNSVPTTALKLNFVGTKSYDSSAATLNNVLNNASTNNVIVVGCSSDATIFTSGTTLAVGSMACISSTDCRGGVLLNDTAATQLNSISYDILKSAFAHELGHALGLGHSSNNEALMYYSASNKLQRKLNQDDVDGITYLYPNEKKLSGLAGACGTVDMNADKSKPINNFLGSFLIGLFLISFITYIGIKMKENFFS
jgi:hypothetical protein